MIITYEKGSHDRPYYGSFRILPSLQEAVDWAKNQGWNTYSAMFFEEQPDGSMVKVTKDVYSKLW